MLFYIHFVVVWFFNFGDAWHHVFHVEFLLGNLHFGNLIYVAGFIVVFIRGIKHELTLEEFQGARSLCSISVDASDDEVPDLFIFNPIQTLRIVSVYHLPVDLGGIRTLPIRCLSSDHFKDCHSESIYIHFFAVIFFVKLRRHKFWSSQN